MAGISRPMQGRQPTMRGSKPTAPGMDLAFNYRRIVGGWLRDKRIAARMTQEDLAKHLGVGHAAISAIELGRSSPGPEQYESLAAVLGLDKEAMGHFLLRYTNPWLFALVFPEKVDKQLQQDIGVMPRRGRGGIH